MTAPAYVDKARVTADLRFRQLHSRADWVDREFPELIDTDKNASLLQMLGIDLDAMAPGDAAASRS
ncbi:hypothetical protein AB0368_35775 [Actinoplanes sp. NPDC051475]|uniref:hypothetical protein n=1 Tax=Actinoplanes sp. NPDC051475 TaxID=3157225 RepID=UPI00345100ED